MVSVAPLITRPQAPIPVPTSAAKARPLLRRATLTRKRDDGDMDIASDDFAPPSPGKRPKVKFDSDVEVWEVGNEWEKDPAVVREEVRRAIQRYLAEDSEAYDRVKEVFSGDQKKEDTPSATSVRNHVLGLLANVSLLSRDCNSLVHAVLGSEWLGRDEGYVTLFVKFLGNLAAAQGGYLSSVLKMLVKNLGHVSRRTGRLPGYPTIHRSQLYKRSHMALRYILQLVPSSSSALAPIMSINFPFDSDSVKDNVIYVENLIKLLEYAPELQSEVLALITEKLVKIDVQVQVDMEDLEDEIGENIVEAVSRPQPVDVDEDSDDSDNDSVMSDDSLDEQSERLKTVKENIEKMDSIIDILFAYYAPIFSTGSIDQRENTLDLLLGHFHGIILPTYRSRHSQFLLFHYSQTSPILIDRFATSCIEVIFDKRQPDIRRQSAAAYLASFVARGAHVSPQVVRDVFDLLGSHLNTLRTEYETSCRGPNLRRYDPFYSTAQALLYIFCFRWRDLTTSTQDGDNTSDTEDNDLDDITFPPSIKEPLHLAIYSKLNPLKICSQAIVSEFARIAHHLRFLYVYPLLETNKHVRISSFRSLASLSLNQPAREVNEEGSGGWQLDAYFPFDPYKLPKSRRWVDGDYVVWKGIPGLDDKKDVDSEDEDDEEVVAEQDDEKEE